MVRPCGCVVSGDQSRQAAYFSYRTRFISFLRPVPCFDGTRGFKVVYGQHFPDCGSIDGTQRRTQELPASEYRLGKLIHRARSGRYVAPQGNSPKTTPPQAAGDPHGEKETTRFSKAPQRLQSRSSVVYHLFKGDVHGLVQGHPGFRVRVQGTVPFKGSGVPTAGMPRLQNTVGSVNARQLSH